MKKVAATGLEPLSNSSAKPQMDNASGAQSGARQSELALLVRAWPGLPADKRAAILSVVRGWVHDGE